MRHVSHAMSPIDAAGREEVNAWAAVITGQQHCECCELPSSCPYVREPLPGIALAGGRDFCGGPRDSMLANGVWAIQELPLLRKPRLILPSQFWNGGSNRTRAPSFASCPRPHLLFLHPNSDIFSPQTDPVDSHTQRGIRALESLAGARYEDISWARCRSVAGSAQWTSLRTDCVLCDANKCNKLLHVCRVLSFALSPLRSALTSTGCLTAAANNSHSTPMTTIPRAWKVPLAARVRSYICLRIYVCGVSCA